MNWKEYQEKVNEWAESTRINRISSLTDFEKNDVNGIIDIALNTLNMQGASRLINKAVSSGIRFSVNEIMELAGVVSDETMLHLVETMTEKFNKEQLATLESYAFSPEVWTVIESKNNVTYADFGASQTAGSEPEKEKAAEAAADRAFDGSAEKTADIIFDEAAETSADETFDQAAEHAAYETFDGTTEQTAEKTTYEASGETTDKTSDKSENHSNHRFFHHHKNHEKNSDADIEYYKTISEAQSANNINCKLGNPLVRTAKKLNKKRYSVFGMAAAFGIGYILSRRKK